MLILLELIFSVNPLLILKKYIFSFFFYLYLSLQLFIEILLYFFLFKKILNLESLYYYKKKKIRNKLLNHLSNSIIYAKYNCSYEAIENNLFFYNSNFKFLSRTTPIISFLVSILRKNNNYLDKRKNSLFNLLFKKKLYPSKKIIKNFKLSKKDDFNIYSVILDFKKLFLHNKNQLKINKYCKRVECITKKIKVIKTLKTKLNQRTYSYQLAPEKNFFFKHSLVKLNNDYFFSNDLKKKNLKLITTKTFKPNFLEKISDAIYFFTNGNSLFRFYTSNTKKINIIFQKKIKLNKVIFASSAACENYFHFIYEILIPTYYVFIRTKKKYNVVIPNIFPKFNKILYQLFGDKLFVINDYQNTLLECTDSISANFVNLFENFYPELNKSNYIDNRIYINSKSLLLFKKKILNIVGKNKLNKNIITLVARKSSNKNPILLKKNAFYYFKKNKEKNFKIIDPISLPIKKQIDYFYNSNKIIVPIGSALANILFCRPKTRIYILCPDFKYNFYDFWLMFGKILKLNITYHPQKIVQNNSILYKRHSNYIVRDFEFLNS